MSAAVDLNCRLADLLGIDWRTHDVTGFTLRVSGHELPTVTVERELFPMGEVDRALRTTTERFTLQAAPVFDLDAMVAAAQAAVTRVVDSAARRERRAIAEGFVHARADLESERRAWEHQRWIDGFQADLLRDPRAAFDASLHYLWRNHFKGGAA